MSNLKFNNRIKRMSKQSLKKKLIVKECLSYKNIGEVLQQEENIELNGQNSKSLAKKIKNWNLKEARHIFQKIKRPMKIQLNKLPHQLNVLKKHLNSF